MNWHDKLIMGGIAFMIIGGIMYMIGLSAVVSANRKARADFQTSLQEARAALHQVLK